VPNVFGKWCKQAELSAVATFCHNIARGLPIQINDPAALLRWSTLMMSSNASCN
jgi:UDP-2-acetamido-2,6-beta-L-arabino-hexul-4-ose reductase